LARIGKGLEFGFCRLRTGPAKDKLSLAFVGMETEVRKDKLAAGQGWEDWPEALGSAPDRAESAALILTATR
jgi:hypothetical protein